MSATSEPKKDKTEFNVKQKCRYYDKGYCKYKKHCRFFHSSKNCDQFLRDGKCEIGKACLCRHPKTCKVWIVDKEGCNRSCQYLHEEGPDSIGDKIKVTNDAESSRDLDERLDKQRENSETSKVVELEKIVEMKDILINKMKEKEVNLQKENESLIEQLEKLKRITANMHRELKRLENFKK